MSKLGYNKYIIAALIVITSLCAGGNFSTFAADSSKTGFTVVLDAGHGGNDVGAVDNGAKEKDINLGVAKKVANLVKKKLKNSKVVMTRDDDTFISLQERANIANRNRADLFVSIHTNSVDKSNKNRTTVSGASVYALGLHKDQNNLNVARRENSVIELESDYKQKYSGFDPSKDESYIIFEMAQKKNLGNSLKFANLAQKQLVSVAGRNDRGVKQAGFWVLWATTMPSVLIELDFICNPTSAEFMTSSEGQEKLAEAIFNAIQCYAEGHTHTAEAPSQQSKCAAYTASANAQEVNTDIPEVSNKHIVAEVSNTTTEESGTLVASSKRKTTTPEVKTTVNNYSKTARARKRRSESSKKISDSRELESDNITLFSEEKYLAKADVQESETEKDEKVVKNNSKEKSSKKSKEKKSKDKKKASTKSTSTELAQTTQTKKTSKKESYKKTIVVASNGQVQNAEDKGGVRTLTQTQTFYKIQILASAERLSDNSPKFCGLSPIDCFQENGLYKYTYGESTNRTEIEKKLYDVKAKFPDAFIIVSRK